MVFVVLGYRIDLTREEIATLGAMPGWLPPWLHWTGWYDWERVTMCLAVALYAVAPARSWRRKLDEWRGIITGTGARP